MTSLILKDPEDCNKVIKVLLNPVHPASLKVWEGDKVLITNYKLMPLCPTFNSEMNDE